MTVSYRPQALAAAKHFRPVMEITLAPTGALMSASEPRYETLTEYVLQLGKPLSVLVGTGLYSFKHPRHPGAVILLQTHQEPWCAACHELLDACRCPLSPLG